MHTGSLIPKTIFGWINKTEASSDEVTTYNMDSFFAPESSAVTNNFRKEKENWCNNVIMLMAAKHVTLTFSERLLGTDGHHDAVYFSDYAEPD